MLPLSSYWKFVFPILVALALAWFYHSLNSRNILTRGIVTYLCSESVIGLTESDEDNTREIDHPEVRMNICKSKAR